MESIRALGEAKGYWLSEITAWNGVIKYQITWNNQIVESHTTLSAALSAFRHYLIKPGGVH